VFVLMLLSESRAHSPLRFPCPCNGGTAGRKGEGLGVRVGFSPAPHSTRLMIRPGQPACFAKTSEVLGVAANRVGPRFGLFKRPTVCVTR